MNPNQDFSERSIFCLTCILSVGIAAISWSYAILLLQASPLTMTIRCLIFALCLIIAAKPRTNKMPLYVRWLYLCRRSHWYFLLTPIFILVLCSLLHPFYLPISLTELLLSAGGYLFLYIFLLCILFISGWDKRSPDLLQYWQKRKEAK